VGTSYDQWKAWVKDRPDAAELLALHPQSPARPSQFKGEAKGCWQITIAEWQPTKLNDLIGVHWATAAKRKGLDRHVLRVWKKVYRVPEATGPRRVHLSITLGKGQRAADPDA
jgi:hypothetical protein